MDWAHDDAVLGAADLKQVFKFEPKETTVLRVTAQYKGPFLWTLKDDKEWSEWLRNEVPSVDGDASGLVLILAKRTGELGFTGMKKVPSDQWLKYVDEDMAKRCDEDRDVSLSPPSQKNTQKSGGQRNLKVLPFSRETFLQIATKFHLHKSTARTVSRSDIPVFSSAEVQMGEKGGPPHPAYVYNCRTTNSWAMDLALNATYFPHCGLTFGILFGCPFSIEKKIVDRLSTATAEVTHPLLMPGIFAEFERSRHIHVVESIIDEIETRILTLDLSPEEMDSMPQSQREAKNRAKRSQWLDTTYLRNQLISWNTQLRKLASHADQLSKIPVPDKMSPDIPSLGSTQLLQGLEASPFRDYGTTVRRVGVKIRDRVQEIVDEYDDKIRDCTMRVDGMAMATQWAQGETNVDIALATSRDSRHMRSIALLTMLFLPGTFFASVFSMTFFDWSTADGVPQVSPYIWIYVVVTTIFTLFTMGLWSYFVIYRQKPKHDCAMDEEIELLPR